MLRVFASPRRRRRLGLAAALVTLGVIVYLGVHFSSPGSPENATGPELPDYKTPKTVPFTRQDRRAVRKVLAKFIATAVSRRHVERSWDLASATMREGVTRNEWESGSIPVQPYPASARGGGSWTAVEYSDRRKVGLNVLVFPQRGSGYGIASAHVDLVKGRDQRWRVDYWMFTKFHGPGTAAPADSASALSEGPPNVHKLPGKTTSHKRHRTRTAAAPAPGGRVVHLGGIWWAVPIGVLALIVLGPLTAITIVFIRNRRAEAEYRRSRR